MERDGEPRQEFDDDFAEDECEAIRLHQDNDHMNTIRSVPRPLANTFARSVADLVAKKKTTCVVGCNKISRRCSEAVSSMA